MTTFAVTGATGQLGRLVVRDLLERGVAPADLVAVVRDEAKAQPLADAGVQVRVASYEDVAALQAALAGVDRLLLISGSEVGKRVAQHGNVVDAARAAGVLRVVYTSLLRADSNTMPLAAEHQATERLLADSGLPTVVLRNGWYVENYTTQLPTYLQVGAIIGAAPDARVAAAPRTDYAAAAAAALLDDGTDTAVYELAGPAASFPELAAALSEAAGQELPYRAVSLEDYRAGLLAAGLDEGTAGFVTALEAGTANGELDGPSTDLERLLGRPATDLRTAVTRLLTPLASRADVVTDAPDRYAKQLVSHLGRRAEFTTEGPESSAQIGSGTARVVVGDGVLTLLAAGPDEESLARVEHVLGSHLERFGARNELVVQWTRSTDTPAAVTPTGA